MMRKLLRDIRYNRRHANLVDGFILSLKNIEIVRPYHNSILIRYDSLSELKRFQKEEPETLKWISDYVKPGDVFYDIGACLGQYSFLAAKKGANVAAFEPSFSNFHALTKNIFLNKFQDKISPFMIALSDKTELKFFSYKNLKPGTSHHKLSDTRSHLSVPVLACALDDLKLAEPTHIKLDTDGHELEVLNGAKETLKTVHSLMVEIDERKDNRDIFDALKQFELLNKYQRLTDYTYNYLWVRR